MHNINPRNEESIEIKDALSSRHRVILTATIDSSLIGVRISNDHYNVAISVPAHELLIAARTLCEPENPLKHTAKLQRVLDDIATERARQEATGTLGAIRLSHLSQLLQRFMADGDIRPADLDRATLRLELIILAAVATAWAESLTPEGSANLA